MLVLLIQLILDYCAAVPVWTGSHELLWLCTILNY